jgi:hypothetical protein
LRSSRRFAIAHIDARQHKAIFRPRHADVEETASLFKIGNFVRSRGEQCVFHSNDVDARKLEAFRRVQG